MRVAIAVCLSLSVALAYSPAMAQDVKTLRRELDEMRKQFATMKEQSRQYERQIQVMTERLQRLEAQPRVAAVQPTLAQAPPESRPSLTELARPREPFGLYTRRAPGQFLLDMGVVGDFVANALQERVEQADAGTFAGRENRFFAREVELLFFGQVDPYARGAVLLESAEEFEDGQRVTEFGLAEAHLTLLTLPFGTQLKMGQMRNRFGLLNEFHQHDLPHVDRPNTLVAFFGEEQLNEKGVEITWLPPLPVFLEVLGGVFNGENEEAFGSDRLFREPLVTGRLRTFFELGATSAVQLGASVANGETDEELDNTVLGVDAKYKLTPEGWQHALFTLGGEWLYGHRDVVEEATGLESDVDRTGFYVWGEVQPWRRWIGGVRGDWTELPIEEGEEWAVEPYLVFMPSEFLRFRAAYKHTDRSDDFPAPAAGSNQEADEFLFQATFFLGAHPVHRF